MNNSLVKCLLITMVLCHAIAAGAQGDTAEALAPWLDIPGSWVRGVENGVVAVVPGDLAAGASLLLLVEPQSSSSESLIADYERALTDLAPWTPVGDPIEQSFNTGWVFRSGVGVVELNGDVYTAQTTVARHGDLRARFWVLADSDNTFNRYKDAIGIAVSSVQDLTAGTAPAAGALDPQAGSKLAVTSIGSSFGEDVSGVYVGLERGLSASAGFGQGQQQTYNQSTGQFETSMTGTAPGVQTSIADYVEIDVLFPDGSYRRRMPDRGLASDLAWDRMKRRPLWGTWSRQGDIIVTDRSGYRATYRIHGEELISERDRAWVKLPLPQNSRIDGSFARADYRDPGAPRLVLFADGRYEDRGAFLRMVGSAANLLVPDGDSMVSRWSDAEAQRALAGGSGTYTFEAFTLTLNDRDGRIWQIGTYIPAGDNLSTPRQLVVNGRLLTRD